MPRPMPAAAKSSGMGTKPTGCNVETLLVSEIASDLSAMPARKLFFAAVSIVNSISGGARNTVDFFVNGFTPVRSAPGTTRNFPKPGNTNPEAAFEYACLANSARTWATIPTSMPVVFAISAASFFFGLENINQVRGGILQQA